MLKFAKSCQSYRGFVVVADSLWEVVGSHCFFMKMFMLSWNKFIIGFNESVRKYFRTVF